MLHSVNGSETQGKVYVLLGWVVDKDLKRAGPKLREDAGEHDAQVRVPRGDALLEWLRGSESIEANSLQEPREDWPRSRG